MKARALLSSALLLLAGCARPSAPDDTARVRDLLARLQRFSTGGRHGSHHRGNNSLQRELWSALKELRPGNDALVLEAAECVYTRYDENYYIGIRWHWPYLSSPRAIELCDRLAAASDPEIRERALWIKAFALRCPPMEPWTEAEQEMETYAEQVKWKPDYEASREVYRRIAREFPQTDRGRAAARLASKPELSFLLPKGPKEPDPRHPDH